VGMEERYKKYIEKAKSVIKTLDPKQTPGGGAPPEVNLLRSQLAEKDRVIDELEKESEKSKVLLNLLFSLFLGLIFICKEIRVADPHYKKLSKNTIYLSLGFHKGRPSCRRSLQPSNENIQLFKT
jgi:hypothetical protein